MNDEIPFEIIQEGIIDSKYHYLIKYRKRKAREFFIKLR